MDMTELVNLLQMNYTMNRVKAFVSSKGNELIVNVLDDEIVSSFNDMKEILDNKNLYSPSDISSAEKFISNLKEQNIESIKGQNPQDRAFFVEAGVKKYTALVDGNHLYTIDF